MGNRACDTRDAVEESLDFLNSSGHIDGQLFFVASASEIALAIILRESVHC